MPALADGSLTPYAAEEIEHNSNIFDLPKGVAQPEGKHGPTNSDTSFETRAGIEGTYFLDQQKLFGTAEFRHYDFENFTVLDHSENLIDGGLKWRLAQPIDGQVEYRHEQRMVQFQDLTAVTQLILENENNATASLNVHVTPEWRWETLATDHVLNSPRVNVPGLSLHEDSIKEGLKYLGVSNLAAGGEVSYLDGKYNHDPLALNPDYHQFSVALAATYIVSGLTNFTGDVGYTKRVDPTNAGLSGLTGTIGYRHSVTAKTSFNLQVNRTLSTYLTTGGNEIDTSASGTVNYQATYKILVRAGYSYTDSKFPGAPAGAATIDRIDHFQAANVDVTYQVLHWLSIRPYARYQTRHSNQAIYAFDANVVGIEFLVKKPQPNRQVN